MTNKHSINDLYQMQALSLASKIQMSKARIRAWVEEYGEDGVYISFSGGKDSTVLLDLVRSEYPNVKAVFVDTGLEYPEIRSFVKTFDNVEILKIYNAHDRIMIRIYEAQENGGEDLEALYKEQERIEKALELIDACVIDGLVYATYEDGLILKDLIWAYNARH